MWIIETTDAIPKKDGTDFISTSYFEKQLIGIMNCMTQKPEEAMKFDTKGGATNAIHKYFRYHKNVRAIKLPAK